MLLVKDYVKNRLAYTTPAQVSKLMGVSTAMVSSYKNHSYMPSIEVAKKVYSIDGTVLHPFSEESLKFEIARS